MRKYIFGLFLTFTSVVVGQNISQFAEETSTAGINITYAGPYMVGGGVSAFDCNSDGFPELAIAGGSGPAKLYLNHSSTGSTLKFSEKKSGIEYSDVIGFYAVDIDSDKIIDLVILRNGENILAKGLGDCMFAYANKEWGYQSDTAWTTSFSAMFEKGSKWPTLAFGNYIDPKSSFPWGSCKGNTLLRPQPTGAPYTKITPLEPSFCALSMLFSDWDQSGFPSLRVANDREYYRNGQEQLWKIRPGQPPMLFAKQDGWRPLHIWGMGIASYVLEGNSAPSYFITSMGDNKLQTPSSLQKANFDDQAFAKNLTAHRPYTGGDVHMSTAWHAQFEDVNNDSYVDLFIAKGNVGFMKDAAARDPNNLLLGSPEGTFTEAGDSSGLLSFSRGRGAQITDLNRDGWMDIVVVNRLEGAQIWRNNSAMLEGNTKNNWIKVSLSGSESNPFAIGSWIEVLLPDGRIVLKEVTVGGGHASGGLEAAHFGLGKFESAEIRVMWPDGTKSGWKKTTANTWVTIER